MADQEWTVKELTEALKRFPVDAKVYYDMGPNGPETIGKAVFPPRLRCGRPFEVVNRDS